MTRSPEIAALRRRFVLENAIETPDESGGFTRTWQALEEIWGKIETLKVTDEFTASRGAMQITHRITIRWRPDITGAMRLREGARSFEIVAAQDADPKRRYLNCQCRETAP